MFGLPIQIAALLLLAFTKAHIVITYPGWRGDNLHTNGTLPENDVDALGINQYENGTKSFPYGMQWMYPCGGLPQAQNRTKWPVSGGAVAFQPGWFQGHSSAQLYINFGIQEPGMVAPPNMSHNVIKSIAINGPTNDAYPNMGVCFPQVPLPSNLTFNVGDLLTIQVVETAQHGAALYSCVDIELAEDGDPEIPEITPQNCINDSSIEFNLYYSAVSLDGTSGASILARPSSWGAITAIAFALVFGLLS